MYINLTAWFMKTQEDSTAGHTLASSGIQCYTRLEFSLSWKMRLQNSFCFNNSLKNHWKESLVVKFNLKLQAYIVYNKSKSVRFKQTGLREGFLWFELQIERISVIVLSMVWSIYMTCVYTDKELVVKCKMKSVFVNMLPEYKPFNHALSHQLQTTLRNSYNSSAIRDCRKLWYICPSVSHCSYVATRHFVTRADDPVEFKPP